MEVKEVVEVVTGAVEDVEGVWGGSSDVDVPESEVGAAAEVTVVLVEEEGAG